MKICIYKARKVIVKVIFTLSLIAFTPIYLKKEKMVNVIFTHIYIQVNVCNGSLYNIFTDCVNLTFTESKYSFTTVKFIFNNAFKSMYIQVKLFLLNIKGCKF